MPPLSNDKPTIQTEHKGFLNLRWRTCPQWLLAEDLRDKCPKAEAGLHTATRHILRLLSLVIGGSDSLKEKGTEIPFF